VLEPSSTVLHYAQTIFEGMKAYHDAEGRVRLFRPDMNMQRMNTSANRIALPVRKFLFSDHTTHSYDRHFMNYRHSMALLY
jgi:branched-subunit amino acid aminotransferase/4-amino-4-deoxychorismate lyase